MASVVTYICLDMLTIYIIIKICDLSISFTNLFIKLKFLFYNIKSRLFNKNFFWLPLLQYIFSPLILDVLFNFFFNLDVFTAPLDLISLSSFFFLILVPILKVIIDKLLSYDTRKLSTIIKVLLLSKSFWFSISYFFILTYTIRVNIFYLNIIPIIYCNYFSFFSLNFNDIYCTIMYMMPNNNLKACRQHGAVFVTDPLYQNYYYVVNGNNQPLLGNIGRGLEAKRRLGLSSLSKYTFTPEQESYVLTFLLNNHRDVYDYIMQGQVGYLDEPVWWKQSNTKRFNELLINGR